MKTHFLSTLSAFSILLTIATPLLGANEESTVDTPPLKPHTNTVIVKNTQGEEADLITKNIDIELNNIGKYVETTITFTFFNQAEQTTEAEFVFPIPKGAQLSQLWLSIEGKLRRSTSVEKNKAKLAYETLVRQAIDPALVEHITDRTFRTRLYPILGNGKKQIRLAYIQKLTEKQGAYPHTLKFNFPNFCKNFTLSLAPQCLSKDKITCEGTTFKKVIGENNLLDLNKKFSFPVIQKRKFFYSKKENLTCINLQGKADKNQTLATIRKAPKHVHLLWDHSYSMGITSQESTITLVENYFTKYPNTKITLELIGSNVKNKIITHAKDNKLLNSQNIRSALKEIKYIGGALPMVPPKFSNQKADTVIAVTDNEGLQQLLRSEKSSKKEGLQTLKEGNSTLFIVCHQMNAIPISAFSLVTSKNGDIVSPQQNNAIDYLTKNIPKIRPTGGLKLSANSQGTYLKNEQLNITGIISDIGKEPTILVNSDTLAINLDSATENPMVERIYAWESYQAIKNTGSRDQIVKFATQWNWVTPYTSLIVLDRVEDYVRYGIRPPENTAVRNKYDEIIQKKNSSIANWPRKQRSAIYKWAQKEFRWIDYLISDNYFKLETWHNAQEVAFTKKQLSVLPRKDQEKWLNNAMNCLNNRPKSSEKDKLIAWEKQIIKLQKEHTKIKHTKLKTLEVNQKIAISVRGVVKVPHTYEFKKAPFLKSAIKKAGGYESDADKETIELYRNGTKFLINPENPNYLPQKLQHGDMLVVQNWANRPDIGGGGGLFDSSGGSDASSSDPFDAPAIRNESDDLKNMMAEMGAPLQRQHHSVTPESTDTKSETWVNFIKLYAQIAKDAQKQKELKLGNNPNTFQIFSALSQAYNTSPEFFIQSAIILSADKNLDISMTSLLQAMEIKPTNRTIQMKVAKTAALIGLAELADQILRQMHSKFPDNSNILWELAKVQQGNITKRKTLDKLRNIKDTHTKKNRYYASDNAIKQRPLPTLADLFLTRKPPKDSLKKLANLPYKDPFAPHVESLFENKPDPETLGFNFHAPKVEADLVVLLDSHSVSPNVYLNIKSPSSERVDARSGHSPNRYGEIFLHPVNQVGFTQSAYLNKRAIPGKIEISVSHNMQNNEVLHPFLAIVTIVKNWNRPTEKRRVIKVWVDPTKSNSQLVDSFEIDLK